ncbi:MAG: DUF3696 domain-containing protein [Clostridiales bacterium]|nr:DUF3696 domain-containing protein [Clostridiales bacterium]
MDSFSVTNIKSFRDCACVDLKPITIIVGKNSCGKSSLIRFPVVLAQTITSGTSSPIKFYGSYIDYGNYENVVFNGGQGPISFSMKCLEKIHNKEHEVELVVSLLKYEKTIIIEKNEVYVDGTLSYGLYRTDDGKYSIKIYQIIGKGNLVMIPEEPIEVVIGSVKTYAFYIYPSAMEDIETEIIDNYFPELDRYADRLVKNSYGIFGELVPDVFHKLKDVYIERKVKGKKDPDQLNFFQISNAFHMYEDLLQRFRHNFSNELSRVTYIGPFRQAPKRIYRDEEFETENVGGYGENIGSVLISGLQNNKLLIDKISAWVERFMGYKLIVDEVNSGYYQILLEDRNGIKSNIMDVGYGISQMLPVIIQVLAESYDAGINEFPTDKVRIKFPRYSGNSLNEAIRLFPSGDKPLMFPEDDKGDENEEFTYDDEDELDDIDEYYYYDDLDEDSDSDEPQVHKYGRTIVIEQPELHLHPAAQSELAELFAEAVIDTENKLLIETHSEHLIRKIQVLVSDPNCRLTNEDVAVFYVDKSEDGGAFVKELKILPNGKFAEKWPSGFFDKAHELSMELLKNSMN